MATKQCLGVSLGVIFCALGCVGLVGCGGNSRSAGTGASAGGTSDGDSDNAGPPSEVAGTIAAPASPGPGWSIRDATPYSRTEHATVLDEARDRMIVVGGATGLDVWALPLSGKDQNQWAPILPQGDSPPADYSNVGSPVSAVYDPFGQRLLV